MILRSKNQHQSRRLSFLHHDPCHGLLVEETGLFVREKWLKHHSLQRPICRTNPGYRGGKISTKGTNDGAAGSSD